jgi:aminoglycoside/choline kinase family phosphotransferase
MVVFADSRDYRGTRLLDKRLQALTVWAAKVLGRTDLGITPASADASFRRYFRVRTGGTDSFIVMDAPPTHEDTAPFIRTASKFLQLGLNVPEILEQDIGNGFLLLSDLGDTTYLSRLTPDTVDRLYGDALGALVVLQAGTFTDPEFFPPYDEVRLRAELELFREWYVPRRLGHTLSAPEHAVIDHTFDLLCASALSQPRVWVHRDYHSRNLMVTERNNPGILDFQDAVTGPVTYDLASLLRDCYIEWPQQRVDGWVNGYYQLARQSDLPLEADEDVFHRWFDRMGVQRHVKVLGIFSRLYYRDGKSAYLDDLPLVFNYVQRVCRRYDDLRPFYELLLRLRGAG